MAPARTHMLPSMQAWWSSVCKIGIYHHVFGHIHHDTHVYHHMFHCYVIKRLSPAKSGFCLKAAGFAASFSQNRSTSPGNNIASDKTLHGTSIFINMKRSDNSKTYFLACQYLTLGLMLLSLGLVIPSFRPDFELKTDVGGRFSMSDILEIRFLVWN